MIVDLLASSSDRVDHIGLPVVLDQVLEVLTVGCLWMWDIVVSEPSLKLSLMPLVVSCFMSVIARIFEEESGHRPDLEPGNQLLAIATSEVANTTMNAFAKENLILMVHYSRCSR